MESEVSIWRLVASHARMSYPASHPQSTYSPLLDLPVTQLPCLPAQLNQLSTNQGSLLSQINTVPLILIIEFLIKITPWGEASVPRILGTHILI